MADDPQDTDLQGKEEEGKKEDSTSTSPRPKQLKITLIDHTYHDYSQLDIQHSDIDDDQADGTENAKSPKLISTQRKGISNFPHKLHRIISSGRYRHIIRWQPHGRSWVILDKELLSSVVCPAHFSHSNFDSFNRSVNGWGFKRLQREGADCKSYYHECFLRGRPDLVRYMTRLVTPGKRLPDPKGEPNFYKMAKEFPLPPDPEPEQAIETYQNHHTNASYAGYPMYANPAMAPGMPPAAMAPPQGAPMAAYPPYYPPMNMGSMPMPPNAPMPQYPYPPTPYGYAPPPGMMAMPYSPQAGMPQQPVMPPQQPGLPQQQGYGYPLYPGMPSAAMPPGAAAMPPGVMPPEAAAMPPGVPNQYAHAYLHYPQGSMPMQQPGGAVMSPAVMPSGAAAIPPGVPNQYAHAYLHHPQGSVTMQQLSSQSANTTATANAQTDVKKEEQKLPSSTKKRLRDERSDDDEGEGKKSEEV